MRNLPSLTSGARGALAGPQDSSRLHKPLMSHYSADAGKHGFLAHAHDPPTPPPHDASSSPSSIASGVVVVVNGAGGVGGGGNYPCNARPPAEYALPVSILRVYGDDV